MKNKLTFAQTSSADGIPKIDIYGRTEAELVNIAFQCAKSRTQTIMINVSNVDRNLLERIAMAGKGMVLFDLRLDVL